MAYWMTRILVWLAGHMPRRPRLWIGGALAELVYLLWRSKRRATIANMAQVAGVPANHPRARALARRSWRNYGRYITDFFYMPNATAEELLARLRDATPAPGWRDHLDRARAGGRGLLIATAHFGSWDVAGIMIASHVPLHAIAETMPDPRLNDFVQRTRARVGIAVVPMERTPRRILRLLQEGSIVATPVDRPLPAGEGVPVTFFGRRCYVPGGIAQLALKSGAAIAVGFCWCDEDYSPTYYGYIAEPIFPVSTGDRRADVIAMTQHIYDAIARAVSEHPTQWYMFRPFWPAEPGPSATEAARLAATSDTTPAVVADR